MFPSFEGHSPGSALDGLRSSIHEQGRVKLSKKNRGEERIHFQGAAVQCGHVRARVSTVVFVVRAQKPIIGRVRPCAHQCSRAKGHGHEH